MNVFSQIQHSSMIKNIDPQICPVGMLSIYLFMRFSVFARFSDLSLPCKRFKLKLIYEDDPFEGISDTCYATLIKKMIKTLELPITTNTHRGQKTQCKLLNQRGCSDTQIKRLGRWEKSRLRANDLTNLRHLLYWNVLNGFD